MKTMGGVARRWNVARTENVAGLNDMRKIYWNVWLDISIRGWGVSHAQIKAQFFVRILRVPEQRDIYRQLESFRPICSIAKVKARLNMTVCCASQLTLIPSRRTISFYTTDGWRCSAWKSRCFPIRRSGRLEQVVARTSVQYCYNILIRLTERDPKWEENL